MAPVLDLWTAPEVGAVEVVELGLAVTVMVLVTGDWVDMAAGVVVVDDPKVDCIGGLDSGAAESGISGSNTANVRRKHTVISFGCLGIKGARYGDCFVMS